MKISVAFVVFLACLLLIDDADAWRRWRLRRAIRRIGRAVRKAADTVKEVGKVVVAAKVTGALISGLGKRSVDEIKEFCMFDTYDMNGDGAIEEEEMNKMIYLTELTELEDIFASMDKSQDDKITLEEFDTERCLKLFMNEDEKLAAAVDGSTKLDTENSFNATTNL